MGILRVIVHFNKLDTGLAGKLDIQILRLIIQQESNKTWDIPPEEIKQYGVYSMPGANNKQRYVTHFHTCLEVSGEIRR